MHMQFCRVLHVHRPMMVGKKKVVYSTLVAVTIATHFSPPNCGIARGDRGLLVC